MKTNKLIPLVISLALGCSSLVTLAGDAQTDGDLSFIDAIKNGKPLTSFRLRYDNKDEDGKTTAHAFTLRSLVGWQTAPFHDFSVGAQLIGVTDSTMISTQSNGM